MNLREEVDRVRQYLEQVEDPIALLEGIFAYAPVGFQIYKPDGHCLLVNQKFVEMFGSAPPPEYNVLEDEIAEKAGVLPLIRRAFEGETVVTPPIWYDPRELKQVNVPEGRRVALAATFFPLYDREQRLSHVAITFRDVTSEMSARQETEAQRDRLESVLKQMPAGVCIVQAPDGALVFANASVAKILGRPDLPPMWRDAHDSPVRRALVDGAASTGVLLGYTRPDGKRVTLRMHVAPVRGRESGIEAAVVTFHDVSAEERASQAQAFLSRAGELLGSSLDWEATLQAVTRLAVPEIADWCAVDIVPIGGGMHEQVAIAHVDPARVELARDFRERYPPDPDASQGVPEVLRTGKALLFPEITDAMLVAGARDAEHLRMMRDLSLHSAMVVPLSARGRTFGAITFIAERRAFDQDDLVLAQELARRAALAVDNARLYREAQEAAQAREAFLSIASHELRTPLTSLQLQVQNLIRHARADTGVLTRERTASTAEKIDSQVQRLTKLVDDLLEVSRIAAGRLSFTTTQVDLAALAKDVAARFAEDAARAGSTIAVKGDASLVGEWDRARLDQVATNLVSNAIKYGQAQPIEIRAERAGDVARLSVRDSGIGIAAADQVRIFGRFERAAEGLKYAGSGLGLWIVRQIVEGMGGSIRVRSEEGRGATFIVELPLGAPRRRTVAPR
jgi:signal transduction histidine kinase/PAS domain-containing protein